MAIYRSVSINFWTDTKIYDKFSPEDKYFMLYCLTNKYTNLCGCYEISYKQIENDTGYNEETIKKLIKRLEEQHKVISYDNENQELLIKNWFKYNWTSSNKLDKPLIQEIKKIKTNKFKIYLAEIYNKRDTVSIPYLYRMDTTDTVSDTITNTDNIKHKYGKYNRIKLTDKEYNKLCKDYGKEFIEQQIDKLDEYVESNNNKNKYSNYNLVLRKSIRENWFNKKKTGDIPSWFNNELKEKELTDEQKRILEEIR